MIGMYYHNGSFNHGCEAIVRSTAIILKDHSLSLFSRRPESDITYGIDDIVSLKHDYELTPLKNNLKYVFAAGMRRLFNNRYWVVELARSPFFDEVSAQDIMMSIGGDNYCYDNTDILGHYHSAIKKKGAKTVLWGCSIEPENITNAIAKDLGKYDLITARESISYDFLAKINPRTKRVADPAFILPKLDVMLPDEFLPRNTVGINVSPLILQCEYESGLTMKNYCRLIQYILETTEMNIALIPHVVEPRNDDRVVLKELYDRFSNTGRVCFIKDTNCMRLKGYISQCRFFVGARTHATIAAYSTGVPTLVVGYSTKSKGIARDLFGTEDGYVIAVQSLSTDDALTNAFTLIQEQEIEIAEKLKECMPAYCEKALSAKDYLLELV